MKPPEKKWPHANAAGQKPQRPAPPATPFKPPVAQAKSAAPPHTRPTPAAPPVYRPQANPSVLQQKTPHPSQPARMPPAAPPVYRPQPSPLVLQAKKVADGRVTGGRDAAPRAAGRAPEAPPAYRPQTPPRVLQAKAAAVRPAPAAAPERRPADAGARRPPRPPACVQAKSAGAARGPAFGRAGLKPFAPPPLVGSLNDVVQLVMAYRVERESKAGGGYRVQIKDRKIVSLGEEKNISISFGTEAHSEHFLAEHGSEKPRLVKWEMNDVFWNMIKYKKGFGKKAGKKKGQQALESLSASKRPSTTPGGSDGASLDSFTKKTALTFYDDWYGVILSNQVPGTAREEFPTSEEEEPVTSAAATTTTPAPKAEAKAKPKAKAKAKAKAKPKAEAKMKPAVVGASSSSSSSSSSENWELINCSDGSQVLKGTREDMLAAQKEMGDDFMALAIS